MRIRTGKLVPQFIGATLRLIARTWRIRITDHTGITVPSGDALPPVIWVLWHNRLLIVPILYERFLKSRKGAALISRSKDGGLLASVITIFGGETVRGSSSRGGSAALMELKRKIDDGYDIYITPDGPRGPRYTLGPGAIWLAQSANVPILPLWVEFSSCWRLGRWDGFVIPKPFAEVSITLQALHKVGTTDGEDEFETERQRLVDLMMAGTVMK